MSESKTDADGNDGYRIAEDFVLITDASNAGLYKSIRYQALGYDHLKDDAVEELLAVRNMADEALERINEDG